MKVRSTIKVNGKVALLMLLLGCSITEPPNTMVELGQVFVSSSNNQIITSYNFSDRTNIQQVSYTIPHRNAAGLVYDDNSSTLYQLNRSDNQLVAFTSLAFSDNELPISPSVTSVDKHFGVQGMTGNGSTAIFTQSANLQNNQLNQLITYKTSFNNLILDRTQNISFKPWDVFIAGNTLFVSEGNSDSLSIFNAFPYKKETNIEPDFKIQIEGITNMGGVFYDIQTDIMFISDIGNEASALDGGIHIIEGFYNKVTHAVLNDSTISTLQQHVIEGANTQLGNPIDVVFDDMSNLIVIAENLTDDGRILGFDLSEILALNTPSDIPPTVNVSHKAASALTIIK